MVSIRGWKLPAGTKLEDEKLRAYFVQIKCDLGKSYDVAAAIGDAEIASEVYSTAGGFDLLVKFYLEDGADVGRFMADKVQCIPGVRDTYTIVTFKAF
jgi:DNA-binding Lrp family transcriptional regulator